MLKPEAEILFKEMLDGVPAAMSLAAICQLFQRTPSVVIGVAHHLQIRPTIVLDGVTYFGSADVDRIGEFLRAYAKQQAEMT